MISGRNMEIYEQYQRTGCTLNKIAQNYGIGKERVRQIIKKVEKQKEMEQLEIYKILRELKTPESYITRMMNGLHRAGIKEIGPFTNEEEIAKARNVGSQTMEYIKKIISICRVTGKTVSIMEKPQKEGNDGGKKMAKDNQSSNTFMVYTKVKNQYDDAKNYLITSGYPCNEDTLRTGECAIICLRHKCVCLPEFGVDGSKRDESSWALIDAWGKADTGMYGDIYYFNIPDHWRWETRERNSENEKKVLLKWKGPRSNGRGKKANDKKDVTVACSPNTGRITISFTNGDVHKKISKTSKIMYAYTGSRIYFREPAEGEKGFTLSKNVTQTNKSDRRTVQLRAEEFKTFLGGKDKENYELKKDESFNLYYIEKKS